MPRPRTGGAVFRRGRWYARITLSREPADAKGERPRLEHAVLRDGQPVTTETRTDEAYARRYARRLQERYDEGSWSPEGREPSPAPTPGGQTVRDCYLARGSSPNTSQPARVRSAPPRATIERRRWTGASSARPSPITPTAPHPQDSTRGAPRGNAANPGVRGKRADGGENRQRGSCAADISALQRGSQQRTGRAADGRTARP